MTKFEYRDTNGRIQEIKIPDSIGLTLIMGLFTGLGGAILGLAIGLCKDAVSLFVNGWE